MFLFSPIHIQNPKKNNVIFFFHRLIRRIPDSWHFLLIVFYSLSHGIFHSCRTAHIRNVANRRYINYFMQSTALRPPTRLISTQMVVKCPIECSMHKIHAETLRMREQFRYKPTYLLNHENVVYFRGFRRVHVPSHQMTSHKQYLNFINEGSKKKK